MGKSAAERMREYRARMSQEKKDISKKKDREYKKKAYDNRSILKKQIDREKDKMKKRRQRANKKALIMTIENQDGYTPYNTPQTLGKAIKKVERALPVSPRRRGAVLHKLCESANLLPKEKKHRGNKISDETKKLVADFYSSDEISYQTPGKADCMVVRENGQKVTKQKKYLLCTVMEAYQAFKQLHPNTEIGKSKFAELRPSHILCIGETPHNVCVCAVHENVTLLLKAHSSLPNDCMELLNIATCKNRSVACSKNTCDKCKNNFLFNQFVKTIPEDQLQEPLKWYQWKKDSGSKECVKFLNEGTLSDIIDELKNQLEKFILHCYEKSTQSAYFKQLRQDPTKCVLQVDFSENFTFVTQNEIQSAYWTHKQCSLYTAVAWLPKKEYMEEKEIMNYVIASDYMLHDKYAIHTFNEILFQKLKKECPTLEEIDIFSDGPSSQFKQKYTLCNITFSSLKVNWHFFATSHGKGAVDGVGGTVKRIVYRGIMSEKWTPSPNDAKSFAECANSTCNGIEVIYCSKEDIKRNIAAFEERVLYIKSIPHLRRIHCVRVRQNYVISYASVSTEAGVQFHFKDTRKKSAENQGSSSGDPAVGEFVSVKVQGKKR